MRWMWIDRIVELVEGERLVAIKNVSMAEEHLHDHFPSDPARGLPGLPLMPASLMIEGMAQSAGILVGHANAFKEKVVLAKINKARIDRDPIPGTTIRYTATLTRIDETGAATEGAIELIDPSTGATEEVGEVALMFSHLDANRAGVEFPKHNFVFSDAFRDVLINSGIDADF